MDTLNDQLHKGLAKDTHATATTKCFPTYVQDLPQGTGKRTRRIHIIDIRIDCRKEWLSWNEKSWWNVVCLTKEVLLSFIEVISFVSLHNTIYTVFHFSSIKVIRVIFQLLIVLNYDSCWFITFIEDIVQFYFFFWVTNFLLSYLFN